MVVHACRSAVIVQRHCGLGQRGGVILPALVKEDRDCLEGTLSGPNKQRSYSIFCVHVDIRAAVDKGGCHYVDLANHTLAWQEGMLSQMVANTQGCGGGYCGCTGSSAKKRFLCCEMPCLICRGRLHLVHRLAGPPIRHIQRYVHTEQNASRILASRMHINIMGFVPKKCVGLLSECRSCRTPCMTL